MTICRMTVYWLDSSTVDWVVRIPDGTYWSMSVASHVQAFTTIQPYQGDTDCLVPANYDVARVVWDEFCRVWLPL